MIKSLKLITLVAIFVGSIYELQAQRRGEIIALSELFTNYTISVSNVGSDGTKEFIVSGFDHNVETAIVNAKRNAIHAVIFRGVVSNNTSVIAQGGYASSGAVLTTPPLCSNPNAMADNNVYFEDFFQNDYIQYINQVTTNIAELDSRVKVKGGYNVKICVQVLYDNLKKRLEADGIIEALADINIGKKAVIMVIPSDVWCIRNGYYQEVDDAGQVVKVMDYERALQENSDMRAMITQFGNIMANEKYLTKSLEMELKRLKTESAEMSLLIGQESSAMIREQPIEMLKRKANTDVIIDIDVIQHQKGGRKQIEFNINAYDAYTSKLIFGKASVGSNSSAPVVLLLEEAALNFKDPYLNQISMYFGDLASVGREVIINLKCFDSAEFDFETEFDYNGQYAELADILGVWFEQNSVGGTYNVYNRSTNNLRVSAMMPLYGKSLSGKEVDMNATGFARSFANILKREPYNAIVKIYPKGLSEVWLIIGEK